jgi:hypothetical protein
MRAGSANVSCLRNKAFRTLDDIANMLMLIIMIDQKSGTETSNSKWQREKPPMPPYVSSP